MAELVKGVNCDWPVPSPWTDAMKAAAMKDAAMVCKMTDRIAALEAALRPFAAIDGVAVPRWKIEPEQDRLWSYFESRTETQYEITRAHIIEAARVLRQR